MHINHEVVQKVMLPREISIVSYQGHCEEKNSANQICIKCNNNVKVRQMQNRYA